MFDCKPDGEVSMTITIGERVVGPGNPAYIVAEIGLNHNGDLDLAYRTIIAAKEAGADAVKFQNYRTEDFVADRDLTYSYTVDGTKVTERVYEMFKRVELSPSMLSAIADHCRKVGVDWHATPTNIDGVSQLVKAGVGVLKNGSDYLGHLPLVEAMAQTDLPVVLSTGMATLSDIEDAVKTVRISGNTKLIILHCTSQYPTPAPEANVRRVPTLARTFGCLSGFSDHTEGSAAALGALAFGAVWIEKHFTLDKSLPGPDHAFSADPEEFKAYVGDLRFLEAALGSSEIRLSEKEEQARIAHRLSCATARELPVGSILSMDNIQFVRPGTGFPPKHRSMLIGRKLKRALSIGTILTTNDFE
jgi:N,N'-diacetyllegionaminate synthase